MSANLSSLLGHPDDPRELELVRGLLEKTKQGKIPWGKEGNAVTMRIPSGIEANFVLGPSSFGGTVDWQLLTIRDRRGRELVRVSNPGIFQIISGDKPRALVSAAGDLYRAVYGVTGDDLDNAIDIIKKL